MKQRAISRGTIRVDARRALSKLREHLLVDPHLYLSELVRGAIACAATEVRVIADADDVIVAWQGGAPSLARATRLFDYLLSEAASPEERRLRLLASGINAALGLSPRFVDLCLVSDAQWKRVRFSTVQLQAGVDTPAPPPEITDIPLPRGAFDAGCTIQVRKRPGFSVLRRALFGGEHPEVSMLRDRVQIFPFPCRWPARSLRRSGPGTSGVHTASGSPRVRGAVCCGYAHFPRRLGAGRSTDPRPLAPAPGGAGRGHCRAGALARGWRGAAHQRLAIGVARGFGLRARDARRRGERTVPGAGCRGARGHRRWRDAGRRGSARGRRSTRGRCGRYGLRGRERSPPRRAPRRRR